MPYLDLCLSFRDVWTELLLGYISENDISGNTANAHVAWMSKSINIEQID